MTDFERGYNIGKRDAFTSASEWLAEDIEGVRAEKLIAFLEKMANDYNDLLPLDDKQRKP